MAPESALEKALARELGLRLQAQRHEAGRSQEDVALEAGISRNHYQLLESGLSDRAKGSPANPRLSTLLDLASALDCEVCKLVGDLDAPRSPAAR